eukprot:TRINITY_DN2435_c0_g1_i2.p1 TRINITY_DN2435_c0_g1~~TRINITY_DN2435_c0_g1_i2.p1  ORF type:complete len:103 (-),score=31.85 TRINITY_DN2435_c0_g1_i2:218-526(-)
MVRVEKSVFFSKAEELCKAAQHTGRSVWFTFKSYHGEVTISKGKKTVADGESMILARITDGKKKFSSIISHKDQVKFQMDFAQLCRTQMTNLKKREKRKGMD